MQTALTVWGLFFDIVGASLVVRSIVLTKARTLASATFTVPSANPALFRALLEQRHDGMCGLGALILGFTLQIGGALVSATYSPRPSLHIALGALLLLGGVAYIIMLRRLQRTAPDRLRTIVDAVIAAQREKTA